MKTLRKILSAVLGLMIVGFCCLPSCLEETNFFVTLLIIVLSFSAIFLMAMLVNHVCELDRSED